MIVKVVGVGFLSSLTSPVELTRIIVPIITYLLMCRYWDQTDNSWYINK